jgi:signal transduction histidine kinase
MLDGTIPPANQQDYLSRVFTETERLNNIVNDLLTLARLRSGKLVFNWEDINPETVVADVVEMFSPQASEAKVSLEFTRPGTSRMLRGDSNRLTQVFINTLDNAIKFSPVGGKVQVLGQWLPGGFQVQIIDEGPGIPPDELSRIFERFYIGNISSDREYPGTGLGLAISKLIVEKHGGSIKASNRKEGGCIITTFLPG